MFWNSHYQFTWHERHGAREIFFALMGFGKYAFQMDVTLNTMALIQYVYVKYIYLQIFQLYLWNLQVCYFAAPPIFVLSFCQNWKVISLFFWGMDDKIFVCLCVCTYKSEKHSLCQRIVFTSTPFNDRPSLFILIFYVLSSDIEYWFKC